MLNLSNFKTETTCKSICKAGFLFRHSFFNKFFYSNLYIFIVALLALCSNIYSIEIFVYQIYCLFAICICIFCDDIIPIITIAIFGYISPSLQNNPGLFEDSIFYLNQEGLHIIKLIAAVLFALFLRLLFDSSKGFKSLFCTRRQLLWGFLVLGISYFISGIRSSHYPEIAIKNIIFATIQFGSLFIFYILLTGCANWNKTPETYIIHVGIAAGLVLVFELFHIYLSQNVIQNGSIVRTNIYTGWGMHNNIGGMLSMFIPFPFYYLRKRTHILSNSIFIILFISGILLSCSRGAILITSLIITFCTFYSLRGSRDCKLLLFMGISCMVIIWFFRKYSSELLLLFKDILIRGLDPTTRDIMYENGIKQFLQNPIFGGSFYPTDYLPWDFSDLDSFSKSFPPRWHNTYIQLLASCGIVGMVSYFIHRIQVFFMFLRNRSCVKVIIEFSTLSLIGTSLLDCHFFNIGPALVYSILLAFAERIDRKVN